MGVISYIFLTPFISISVEKNVQFVLDKQVFLNLFSFLLDVLSIDILKLLFFFFCVFFISINFYHKFQSYARLIAMHAPTRCPAHAQIFRKQQFIV